MSMGHRGMDAAIEILGTAFGARRPVPISTGPGPARSVRYGTDAASSALYLAEIAFRDEFRPRLLFGREIEAFVTGVQDVGWPPWEPCASWPIRVLLVPSMAYARYSNGTITLSSPADESVVLHELAHHFAPFAPSSTRNFHGPTFMAAYLTLIGEVMGSGALAALSGHLGN